jgi:hypothetical protein
MSRRTRRSADLETPFPVLEELALPYIPKKFIKAGRRDVDDLPAPRPGSVLVFHHGSRYVAFDEARPLTGKEEPVVDATAVCLVDTRTRHFTVHMPLPSASPAFDFTIRAVFQCRVTDPARAAEEGPIDITRYLTDYLTQDKRLSKLGSQYGVESITEVRDVVISRIEAYCEFNPIDLPGLAVGLVSASILTPPDLREHEKQKIGEQRRQEIDQIRAEGEDHSIERHKAFVDGGPEVLTVVGMARGETSVNDAIERAREDEKRREELFAKALDALRAEGGMDFLDIDPTSMVSAYLEKLSGQPVSRRSELRERDGDQPEAIASGGENEDDEPPDEAELDE